VNRFPHVFGLRLGYDPEQVDGLIMRIEGTLGRGRLDGPPVTADDVRGARFAVKRGGYNETAVDSALDAFIVALEARLDSPPSPPAPPAANGVSASATSGSVASGSGVRVSDTTDVLEVPLPGDEAALGDLPPPDAVRQAEGDGGTERETGCVRTQHDDAEHDAEHDDGWSAAAVRAEQKEFRPGRLGLGYREQDVDALRERLVATLRGTTDDPVTPREVRAATFTSVILKAGYAVGDVDRFLAEMADVLERR
jgi:DivIVA domain-containing protein